MHFRKSPLWGNGGAGKTFPRRHSKNKSFPLGNIKVPILKFAVQTIARTMNTIRFQKIRNR